MYLIRIILKNTFLKSWSFQPCERSKIEFVGEVLIPDNLIKLDMNKKESKETEKR